MPAPTPSPRQERAPILDAILEYPTRGITALHTPAHKGVELPEGLERLLTPEGLAADLPSLDATDSPRHPTSCIAGAEALAAELHGAGATLLLTGGSTQGVQAMMLATVGPGDVIILSRHLHLSAWAALVLTGATPVYLPARWHDAAGPLPPMETELSELLDRHPRARAVLLTQPSYYGLGRPLTGLATLCHARGLPLLVDEAHGAHLTLLPPGHLRPALEAGADLVVQSSHKTVGSLVGTAWLHRGAHGLISTERLRAALNLLQSTSPSYLLLASLDLTRREAARSGAARFARATEGALTLRQQLATIDGVRPLALDLVNAPLDAPSDAPTDSSAPLAGCLLDPLRLLIDVTGLGLDGFTCERRLRDEFQLYGELADARNVGYVLGPADAADVGDRLVSAFRTLAADRPPSSSSGLVPPLPFVPPRLHASRTPPLVLTPRQAFSRATHAVPLADALGRLAGETVTVYPPGIPLVCPGERVTQEVLDEIGQARALGAMVLASDSTLATVAVIAEE